MISKFRLDIIEDTDTSSDVLPLTPMFKKKDSILKVEYLKNLKRKEARNFRQVPKFVENEKERKNQT